MSDKIRMFVPYVNDAARRNVQETLETSWIGEGPMVELFEEALCLIFDLRHVLALNSGTAALRLALAMCGVGPGDEVITPAQTCTATNMPILGLFARPVFADIQYYTGNIEPTDIEHRITEKTKAIMVVHWAGYPCDMEEIQAVAARHNLPVIEDAAHALGASYGGVPIGQLSPFTMFSFQAIKQLTTGDGGALAMLSGDHYHEARRRRWFGIDRINRRKTANGYYHWDQAEVGYKMHMNDISASIGLGNLEDWAQLREHREEIVRRYRLALNGASGVTLFEKKADRVSANWLFTMHVERRRDFCRMMTSRGIDTSVVHIRNDLHSVFGPLQYLPVTQAYQETNISIPLHSHLTYEDVERVMHAIRGGW